MSNSFVVDSVKDVAALFRRTQVHDIFVKHNLQEIRSGIVCLNKPYLFEFFKGCPRKFSLVFS